MIMVAKDLLPPAVAAAASPANLRSTWALWKADRASQGTISAAIGRSLEHGVKRVVSDDGKAARILQDDSYQTRPQFGTSPA